MLQNLVDIITAPTAAFARLKEKPTIWLPLLLLLFSTVSIQVGYILLTDRGFLADQQIEQIEALAANISDAQLEQMRANIMDTSTTAMILNSAIGGVIFLLIVIALYALYLQFASKFSFVQLGWKAWFALICWTAVPTVFGAIGSWVALLTTSNGQLPMVELNPLNFTNLLGLEDRSGPMTQLGPLYIWHFVLLALGYQHWTNKGLVASTLISLAPYLLIFGIWGYFSG